MGETLARKAMWVAALAVCAGRLSWASGSQPSNHFLKTVQHSLGLSPAIARVTDAALTDARTPPQFILIQDVHCLPEAQENIAAALIQAHQRWAMNTVYLEGAFGPLELSGYRALGRSLDHRELRAKVEEGQWTGSEWMAASVLDQHLQLTGMEDVALYRQALDASLAVGNNADRALDELHRFRRRGPREVRRIASADWNRLEHMLKLKARPQELAQYHRPSAAWPDDLAKTLNDAESFYRLADARSRVFVQRITAQQNPQPAAVVVGGYHTPAMAQALRDRDISFVVITPRVTAAPDPALYRARLQASANALAPAR